MSIKRLSTKSVVTCFSIVALLVIISVTFLGFVLPKNVILVDSGSEANVTTLAKTVEEFLNEKNITLTDSDVIVPDVSDEIEDNMTITIIRAKKVELHADNKNYEIRTDKKTVAELLEEFNITLGEADVLSCNPEDEITDGMVIDVTRARKVSVTVDGQTHERYTIKPTVKDFLDDVCIYLEQYDEITPALETRISDNLDIVISRVTVENVSSEEALDFTVVKKTTDEYEKGKTVVKQEGVKGVAKNTYKIIKRNGELVSKTLVNSETIKKPVEKIVMVGTRPVKTIPSRGDVRYKKLIKCTATAYEPGVQSNGAYAGKTATGRIAGPGIVAVDPSVIPLGSRLYIESTDDGKSWSYGFAVAGDTGGAIKGNKIDLCFSTVAECYNFGRRQCKVYILE